MSISEVNNKIAVYLTEHVGTMWCAYVFMAIAFVSFPDAIKGGTATLIAWIAQTFLQLVLLPIIMVGQSVQGKKTEQRDQEDHEAILAEFQELKAIHLELSVLHKDKAGCGYVSSPSCS